MSGALGLTGWGLALVIVVGAALLRIRLARVTEAIAHACHELRGPITAVQLGLELGGAVRHLSPGRVRALELELGRAALAVDDLSVARMKIHAVRRETVDLAAVVADSVEAWRSAARARGATVKLDWPGGSLWVTGERLRLAQAIGNLIANATEHGGGDVDVRLRELPGLVRLDVQDQGPGLAAPIEQLSARRAFLRVGRPPDHGHGLAIVKRIAVAHGGRLAAAPSDRGARLVLELPASARADADLAWVGGSAPRRPTALNGRLPRPPRPAAP